MRMTRESFNVLCSHLTNLKKQETHLNETVPLNKRIAVALYALGSSAEYRTIANLFGIGKSTVCQILLEFCNEIWNVFKNDLFSYPLTNEVIKKNINGFEKMGFPQCLGAIGKKLIF
jgi:hypothetical protein